MGIDSVGSAAPRTLTYQAQVEDSAPPPAVSEAKGAVIPAQYQSGFDAAPAGPSAAQVNPVVAHGVVKTHSLVADAMMKAGQYETARAFNQVSRTIVEKLGVANERDDQFKGTESVPNGDVGVTLSHENRTTTFGEEVARKEAQINQAEKMSKAIGRPVDPRDLADVKAYFDTVSKAGVPTAEIQKEYGEYLKNNYATVHGNNWGDSPAIAQRVDPKTVTDMMARQPKDVTGRAAIDCEGVTYLTGAIFEKNPRFQTVYTHGGSHLAVSLFEKGTNRGFSVDMSRDTPVNQFSSKTEAQMNKQKIPKDRQQLLVARGQHGERGNASTASRELEGAYAP